MRGTTTSTLDHSTSSIVGNKLVHNARGWSEEPHSSWTENWVRDRGAALEGGEVLGFGDAILLGFGLALMATGVVSAWLGERLCR